MKKVMTPEQFILSLKAIVGCWTIDEFKVSDYKASIDTLIEWSEEASVSDLGEFATTIPNKDYIESLIDYLDNLKPENLL